MSCQNSYETRGASSGNCVKDTVRRIIKAQREVAGESTGYDCLTSCDQSIEDLLSPAREPRGRRHTTIPVMFICKGACGPFYGSGFVGRSDRSRHHHFHCVESPIFKIKGFVRGSNNCVKLELLRPVYHRGEGEGGGECCDKGSCNSSVCNHFGHQPIENFRYTGVCITVDLDCFCGISCLDPVTPARP